MYKRKLEIFEQKVFSKDIIATDFHMDLSIVSFQLLAKCRPHPKNEPHYRTFDFYSISHLVGGQGVFWDNEKMTIVHPGQAVIICPGMVHDYFGFNEYYIEDGIDFTGPIADYLHEKGLLKSGIIDLGKERCLDKAIHNHISLDFRAKIRAKLELINLLLKLPSPDSNKVKDEQLGRLDKLIRMIYNNPEKWWTVAEMADICKLSQVQFRRVFKYQVGVTPKRFIDEVKLKAAAQKLQYTDMSLTQLAEQFNYKDQFHFSRRFKELFGITPAKYRQQ
jgi:AraC-like DNA-binding protein